MDTGVDNLPSTAGIDDFVQRRVLMRKLVVLGITVLRGPRGCGVPLCLCQRDGR